MTDGRSTPDGESALTREADDSRSDMGVPPRRGIFQIPRDYR